MDRIAEKPVEFDLKKIKIRKERAKLEKSYDWKSLKVGGGFTVDNSIAATVRACAHGYAAKCKDKDGKATVKFQSQKNDDKKTTSVIRVA